MVAAFGYFTIVPVPRRDAAPGGGALAALPFTGACIGGLAGFAGAVAAHALPGPLPAIVALAALAIATGAIHLDGFLDCCDGVFASVPAERRREILKDPRHGTFAIAGFAIVASLAGAALAAVPPVAFPRILAFSAAAARLGAVAGAFVFPAATAPGAGPHFPRSRAIVVALALQFVSVAAAGYAIVPWAALLVPAFVVTGLACERWIAGRLGGLVGDAYGFTIVTLETLAVVAFAGAFAHRP